MVQSLVRKISVNRKDSSETVRPIPMVVKGILLTKGVSGRFANATGVRRLRFEVNFALRWAR